jgi:hypothetical protein
VRCARSGGDQERRDRDDRRRLLLAVALDRVEIAVRRAVEAGDPGSVALWNRTGGQGRFDRRRAWWIAHRDGLAAALR